MNFSFSYPIDFKFDYEGTLPFLTSNLRHIPKSLWMNQILFSITAKDVTNLENTCHYFRDLTVKSAFWQHACASRTQPHADPFAPEIEAITDIYDRSSLYRTLFIQREFGHETWRLERVTDGNGLIQYPIAEQIQVKKGLWRVTLPEPQSRVITEDFSDLTYSLTIKDRIGIVGVVFLQDKVNKFYQSPNGLMVQLETLKEYFFLKPDINNLIPNLNQWMSKVKLVKLEAEKRRRKIQDEFYEKNLNGYKMNFPYPISFKFKYEGELPFSTSKLKYIPNNLWTHYILPNITPKDLTNLENTCCYFRDLVVRNDLWHQVCASRIQFWYQAIILKTQPLFDPFEPVIEATTNIYTKSALYRALFIQRECGQEAWRLEQTTDAGLIGDLIGKPSPGFLRCVKLPGSRDMRERFIKSDWRLIIMDPKGTVANFSIPDKVLNFYSNGVQLETHKEYYVLKPDINNLIPGLNKRLGRLGPNKPKPSDSEIACQERISWAHRMKASVSAPLKFRKRRDLREKQRCDLEKGVFPVD